MTGEQWRRAKPVLTAALGLDRVERDRLLRSAFEDEGELRAQVAAVLRDHDLVSSRLRAAVVGTTHLRSDTVDSREFEELLARDAESSAPFLEPGDSCGPYRIVRQLGVGGMGQVYLAEDTALGTAVALKFVAERWLGSPEAAARLHLEAARAAQLRFHPNIATVLHFTELEHKGRPVSVLVMEYVPGPAASQLLSSGPLDAKQAIASVIEVTRALEFAHGKGILHCDVKPANLLIHETPASKQVKVVDFGIARALSIGGMATSGTVPYMAPELLATGECGIAADVYALGVTLFELVTGQRPYRSGELDDVVLEITGGPVPRASAFVSGLPADLDDVLQRAMAKAPEARFPSMAAFRSALEALEPIPPAAASVQWWRASAAAAVGGMLIAALGFVTSLALDQGLARTGDAFSAATLFQWFYWGSRSVVAPLMFSAALLLGAVCVRSAAGLLWGGLRRYRWAQSIGPRASSMGEAITALPTAISSRILLLVHVGLLAGLSIHFAPLLAGFMHFTTRSPESLAVLAPSNQPMHEQFGYLVTLELLVFCLAWGWLLRRHREREEKDAALYLTAGILAAVLSLSFFSIRFRILTHNKYERVAYREATCYLVEERGASTLLFCPLEFPRNVVVPASTIRRSGIVESIFAPLAH